VPLSIAAFAGMRREGKRRLRLFEAQPSFQRPGNSEKRKGARRAGTAGCPFLAPSFGQAVNRRQFGMPTKEGGLFMKKALKYLGKPSRS